MRHYRDDRIVNECVDLRSFSERELAGYLFGTSSRCNFTIDGRRVYNLMRGSLSTNCGGRRLTITQAQSPFLCDYRLVEPRSNRLTPNFGEGVTHVLATVPAPELVSALRTGMDSLLEDESKPWFRDLSVAQGVSEYSRLGNYWYSYHMNVHSFNHERWTSTLDGDEYDDPCDCPDCGSDEIREDDWGTWYCENCEYGWDPADYDERRMNDDADPCWAKGLLDVERGQYKDELRQYIIDDVEGYSAGARHLKCQLFCDTSEGQRYAMGVLPAVVAHVRWWNADLKEEVVSRSARLAKETFERGLEPWDMFSHHVEASLVDTLRRTGAFSISTNVANPGCTYTLAYIAWLWENRSYLSDMLGVRVVMPVRMASNPNEASHALDSAIVYVYNANQFSHQVRYDNPNSFRTASYAKGPYFQMELDERGVLDV